MEKEERRLVVEIVFMLLVMLITIPICANASNDYYNKKGNVILNQNVLVSINQGVNGKQICIHNFSSEKTSISLVMKIRKFSNEYAIQLDGYEYHLSEISRSEDEEYYYYNLGSYEIDTEKLIDYEFMLVGDNLYEDDIIYSFIAEVVNF